MLHQVIDRFGRHEVDDDETFEAAVGIAPDAANEPSASVDERIAADMFRNALGDLIKEGMVPESAARSGDPWDGLPARAKRSLVVLSEAFRRIEQRGLARLQHLDLDDCPAPCAAVRDQEEVTVFCDGAVDRFRRIEMDGAEDEVVDRFRSLQVEDDLDRQETCFDAAIAQEMFREAFDELSAESLLPALTTGDDPWERLFDKTKLNMAVFARHFRRVREAR